MVGARPQDQSQWDEWLLDIMAGILRAGLSSQDTEELLWEAMEVTGIRPDVAETVAVFGGPPILVVPGMGAAEAKERAQRPLWRATYLLAMARRLQRFVDQSLAQGVPDLDWQPLRAALRARPGGIYPGRRECCRGDSACWRQATPRSPTPSGPRNPRSQDPG